MRPRYFQLMKNPPLGWVLTLILICYLIGLSGMSVPLTGDQKVYLSIALEMKERGSWVIPYLFDSPNFLKPPLQYWATLLGWSVGGLSVFWAMVPSVMAVIGSAWMIQKIIPETRSLAALFFAATFGTMTYGTTAQMEIWIVLFYLWGWKEWRQGRPFVSLTIVGVMAWIKGPLYPVLWVVSVMGERWYVRKQKPHHCFSIREILALLWGAGVGLSWYGLAAQTEWLAMKAVFFERENLGKMSTSQGSPGGLWASFIFSLLPVFPAVLLGFLSQQSWSAMKKHQSFLIFYSALPALFFTFFPYRVNTYLYLLTPIVMMAAILGLNRTGNRETGEGETVIERRARWILLGAMFCSAALLLWAASRMAQGSWVGWELVIPLGFNLALWIWSFFTRRWLIFGASALLVVSLVRVAAVQIGERDLAGLRAYIQDEPRVSLAYWIQEQDIWHEFGLVSAALGQGTKRLAREQLEPFVRDGGTLILDETQKAQLELNLNCREWPRLKKRMKFPFERLLVEGLSASDPDVLRMFFLCKARH